MSKTSSVFTRIEPELKEQAEQVLSQLGLPMANAINLFLRQVVLQNGIPFAVKLPESRPADISLLSPEQLDSEIQKGFDDLSTGGVMPSNQVQAEVRKLYG